MTVLVVHNSDEIGEVFSGNEEDMLEKLKKSNYWEEITDRLDDIEEDDITLSNITDLYHDGDSEWGFELVETK